MTPPIFSKLLLLYLLLANHFSHAKSLLIYEGLNATLVSIDFPKNIIHYKVYYFWHQKTLTNLSNSSFSLFSLLVWLSLDLIVKDLV